MEYIFVYGIFRDISHRFFDNAILCDKSFAIGKIYCVNEFYPGIKLGNSGIVVGDLYLINKDIFDEFDEFEGDEYIRKKTNICTFSGDILESWIYEYKYDISNFKEIAIGDWILR